MTGAETPRTLHAVMIRGAVLDDETRCAHWHGDDDVLAILFPCCGAWYPCHACHEDHAGHEAAVWRGDQADRRALLCGRCGETLSIRHYRATGMCDACGGRFNDGCRLHHHLYFA